MKNIAMCVIDGTTRFLSLQQLLNQRCVAALPFAGRYRLIDFALSNATHSGITNVSIFPDGDYYSLSDHIQSGKFWGLDRKVDGLFLLPPKNEMTRTANSLTFQRMREYIDYFIRSRQKYVFLYPANIVTTIKFEKIVESHINSKADVTQVYYRNKPVEIFVLSREYLIDLILRHDVSPYQTVYHLVEMAEGLKVNQYHHIYYTRAIDSLLSYYRANLDILHPEYGFQVFLIDRPVLTQTNDEVPTFYTKQADVSNSLVANGCIIEGTVENSVIFRGVKIKSGAVVKNSVLLPKTVIEENTIAEQVITDKHAYIGNEAYLVGQHYAPHLVEKGQRVMGSKGINAVHVSSECQPFYKTGGLADVVSELSQELVYQGLNVDVILPFLNTLPKRYQETTTHKLRSTIKVGDVEVPYDVYRYNNAGINYYFISCGEITRDKLYGYPDDTLRYELYCYLVLDFIEKSGQKYDVIHCHDWHTGLLPYFMKNVFSKHTNHFQYTKTVFTIHNIYYQGICDISDLTIIPRQDVLPNEIMLFEKVNFMKAALVMADEITTVSETYKNEICYPYFGEQLDRFILGRKDNLHGILNGVNYINNNPETDIHIARRYSVKNYDLKKENKMQMQRDLGLPVNKDVPVIGMVSRIVEQKGFLLIMEVFEELMKENIQFVLLGDGDPELTRELQTMARKYPTKVSVSIGYHSYKPNMIYAASDLFLMPSRFEPCGISQMIALKYGSIPIVHETGGLKDTITPYNEFIQQGNGFGFAHHTAHDMLFTIKRALNFYQMPEHWNRLVQVAMTQDWSWAQSTPKYIHLYRSLVNES